MLTPTADYERISRERTAARLGLDSIEVREMLGVGKATSFTASSSLFGCSVPTEQMFWPIKVKFRYKGKDYTYVGEPILKEIVEKDLFSSSVHAILDDEAMEESFKVALQEIK